MTQLSIIPVGNLIDVLVSNLTLAKGAEPILDAQLVVNVIDSSGTVVIDPVAMTAEAMPSTGTNNSYRASFDSSSLTELAQYTVQVVGSNYTVQWAQEFRCVRRSFAM